jgi:pimeloyl-ACP methyl ester carboxylesterase
MAAKDVKFSRDARERIMKGVDILASYKVVVTGTHPEYHTKETLDALQAYTETGGRLMYLGGNGFYWRVALSDAVPGAIEVRRTEGGIRTWPAEPGEYYHAFDGAYGGLWRRSDRPPTAEAYDDDQYVADALAVLDATGTREAVLVGLSRGGRWAVELAATRPERFLGAMLIDPALPFLAPLPREQANSFDEELDRSDGWAKFNRHYWLREYRDFLEFFASQAFSESHSTKQIEDMVGWGLETSPEALILTQLGAQPASREELEAARAHVDELVAGVGDGRFEVTASPHWALCHDCPARRRLCSHPKERTGGRLR